MNTTDLRALETAREKQIEISNGLSEKINEMREKTGKEFDADKFNRLSIDFATSENQVRNLERQIEDLKGPSVGLSKTGVKNAVEGSPSVRFLRAAVLKGDGSQGLEGWEIDEQRELRDGDAFKGLAKPTDYIIRAAATTTTGAGAISHDTMSVLVENLQNYGGARKILGRISTAGGNALDFPKEDDATATGEQISTENSVAGEHDQPTIGDTTFGGYTFSSKFVDLSRELIADTAASGLDILGLSTRKALRRLGKVTNALFTNGSGTNTCEGFMARAKDGVTSAAAGGANNIAYKDLVDMIYSIEQAYLDGGEMAEGGAPGRSGFVGWTFHRNFEAIVMKMLDGDNRPLWAPGLSSIAGSARQNMLLGYPYEVNFDMPSDMTGGAIRKVAAFGAFGGYHLIRDCGPGVLLRIFDNDSYVGSRNQTRLVAFSRHDSRYIGNGAAGANANEYKVLKAKA